MKDVVKKIIITGGPGTGKSTLVNHLTDKGYTCMEEISRQVTIEAQAQGIGQLFLKDPLQFSNKLLEGRIGQFLDADKMKDSHVFFDRGIPDVLAYMNYKGDPYPPSYDEHSRLYRYDKVFILPPWEAIYISDSVRYENFDQANSIHEHLVSTYEDFGYNLLEVPVGTIETRADFILNHLKL
ncbi:AAA family ATPase [Robertkochia solimangrovi]|uniref:AAA family ATPase n=1 Tax=Robertkochia solimangrovi TaxID=2213046 RepID=UPI00117E000A|nr:ATP-binding protein [Robertkochia solimangrovi]TRZ42870.1 ATPase [Robertkochia solimangrovi]